MLHPQKLRVGDGTSLHYIRSCPVSRIKSDPQIAQIFELLICAICGCSWRCTLFRIGDFSKISQVSVRMLRHYDQLGLLRPGHVDPWTGYRYYTVEQLARLNRIVALNGLGLTLQQIHDLLDKDGDLPVERLRGMLTLRRAEIEQELLAKQLQLAGVEARLQQIELEGKPSPYEIVVKEVEPMAVASVRQTVPQITQMGFYCEQLYGSLYGQLRAARIEPWEPEITLYHVLEYVETDLETEMAVAVDPRHLRQSPAEVGFQLYELPPVEQAATLVYHGPFAELTPAVLALLGWVAACGRVPDGPLRELHLSGPAHDRGEEAAPVIELQLPVRMAEEA
jgi:DNA-binding transcriptional MerR regulator